jgi:hypothetical protein
LFSAPVTNFPREELNKFFPEPFVEPPRRSSPAGLNDSHVDHFNLGLTWAAVTLVVECPPLQSIVAENQQSSSSLSQPFLINKEKHKKSPHD